MNSLRSKILSSVFSARLTPSPLTFDVRRGYFTCLWHNSVLNEKEYFHNTSFKKITLFPPSIYHKCECKYSEDTKSEIISKNTKSSNACDLMTHEQKHNSVTLVEEPDLFLSELSDDWTTEMKWITSQESRDVLLPPKDSSDIDVLSPELRPSFNLAAYVNRSHTLQEMVKLGVDLSKWEKRRGISTFILRLDFEKDMKQHILFLHDVGVPADDLGRWLTINPLIFKENLDNLKARLDYLQTMKFTPDQITRIISKNPYWLLFSCVRIDNRLGYFQRNFDLSGAEVRLLAAKQPRLITLNLYDIKRTSFAVLEEMGFKEAEMKSLLLTKPKIWMAHGVSLLRRFDFIHSEMGLTHAQLVQFPQILLSRDFRLKQRHSYLKLLGRNQYNPLKSNYVSPLDIATGNDADFSLNVAKTSVQDFNNFLKTM